jgi:hypothetical protein
MAPRAHAAAPGPPPSGSPLPYFQGLKGCVDLGLGFRMVIGFWVLGLGIGKFEHPVRARTRGGEQRRRLKHASMW